MGPYLGLISGVLGLVPKFGPYIRSLGPYVWSLGLVWCLGPWVPRINPSRVVWVVVGANGMVMCSTHLLTMPYAAGKNP